MIKLAINGFGRIGRLVFRAALLSYADKVEVAAINTSGSMDIAGWVHLLKYDSVYGRFPKEIKVEMARKQNGEIGKLVIEGKDYPFLAIREPEKIPWQKYGVEVVIESTGVFRNKEKASKHFTGGAKNVIISAPPKGEGIPSYVLGVNTKNYKGEGLISNCSCTTYSVAPIIKIVLDHFGIEKVAMTTVHAYTADQQLVDGSHKDLRRARSAATNSIPTSSGAAKSVTAVLPRLAGKFCAHAIRVPIICGSLSDLTFITSKKVTKEGINSFFRQKAQEEYKGIVSVTDEPLVSSDIIGNPASAIVDLSLTEVIEENLLKVFTWYDNEWAYACRLIELASHISS